MKILNSLHEELILFYDIETVPVVENLKEHKDIFNSWNYKVNKDKSLCDGEVIELYQKNSTLHPEFSKIVCIVAGVISKNQYHLSVIKDFNEKEILNSFRKVLEDFQSYRLAGWCNTTYDTPFVVKRMIINGIKPNESIDHSGMKPWEINEIDLAKVWQGFSPSKASLSNVATALGLPSPKDDIIGTDVSKVFYEEKNLDRIADYCKKDVVTTINIFRKMTFREPIL